MSDDSQKSPNSATPVGALEVIARNLRKPPLAFALGALIVLLIAAGIVSDSQAPLYASAIVLVTVVALLVAGRSAPTARPSVHIAKDFEARDATFLNRKGTGGSARPHAPDIRVGGNAVWTGVNAGNDERGTPDPKGPPTDKPTNP